MISLVNKDYADKQFLKSGFDFLASGKNGVRALVLLGLLVLSGCAVVPSTNIQQPLTVRPQPLSAPLVGNGAIYQVGYSKLFLFEDRRARSVGDTLTVAINEKDNGSSSTSSADAHSGKTALTLSGGLSGATLGAFGALQGTNTADVSYKDSGANGKTNTFTGTLTVTVIEVLSNGNLVVSGEKQVAVGEKTEYLRLSGVVNPTNIGSANTVSSSQLADARIEIKDNTSIDAAKLTSMLARFFLSVAF
jgi:flagellar L-ring protein precursor FlgH